MSGAIDLAELDPARFIHLVLDGLPDDPRDASVEDMRVLSAASEGLEVRVQAVTDAWKAIAARVLDGGAEHVEFGEAALLNLLTRRCVLARDELHSYTRSALRARGFHITTNE